LVARAADPVAVGLIRRTDWLPPLTGPPG
jgi:hypothetical protein